MNKSQIVDCLQEALVAGNVLQVVKEILITKTMPKDIRKKLSKAVESGTVGKVAEEIVRAGKRNCKAYDSVSEMVTDINNGATTEELCSKYGISRSTLYQYLKKKYQKRPGWYTTCLKKLRSNKQKSLKAKEMAQTEHQAELAYESTEKEETKACERKFYILDDQLIQRYDGRIYWDRLMAELERQEADFAVYSVQRLTYLTDRRFSDCIRALAKRILDDDSIEKIDSQYYINIIAKKLGAIVISNNDVVKKFCKAENVDIIDVRDFIK